MASKRNSRGRETTPLMEYRRRRRDDPYGPTFPNDSFDKEDRRPILGRMTTAFSTMFSPIVVAVSSRRHDGRNSPLTNVSTKGNANLNPKHQEDDDEYYEDTYNELPWKCSFGTTEEDGIWMNRNDSAGIIMVSMVWLLLLYSIGTVAWLAHHQHLPGVFASVYGAVAVLALASHAKTSLTDPGAIPRSAIPCATSKNAIHLMCTHCQSYKPPKSHHCRICNRCVSFMDHHCPWMNNCVGVGNMKHFILFLVYTWMSSSLALVIFAWSYFLCSTDASSTCITSPSLVLVNLIRAMTVIAVGALIFTTSMVAAITLGITTGLGTIDRMKIKATQNIGDTPHKAPPLSWEDAEDPIPLNHVFGDQGYWTWWLPIDPIWDDYERVMGYATRDRLNREQILDRESDSRDSEFEGYSQV